MTFTQKDKQRRDVTFEREFREAANQINCWIMKIHTTLSGTPFDLRVVAYCRISTDSEEQLLSYNSQVTHYRQLVKNKTEWELVEIYADKAISGTQINNRIGFQKMINDALDSKIDLIITKSIYRFVRNTLDTLKYVRLLKEHNVALFFEYL